MPTPCWTRLFRVRPYLGGYQYGITLPFTVRLDHAAALSLFTAGWWVTLWMTGWYLLSPHPTISLVAIFGPIGVVRWWLKQPTVDGRDRIEQVIQGISGLVVTAGYRWRHRSGSTARRYRRTVEIGGRGQ